MTITLFPSVVWALDAATEVLVGDWYRQLGSDTQTFLKPARNVAEVTEHVEYFNRASFPTLVAPLGIVIPEKTRVNVAMLAYGMGGRAFGRWMEVEQALQRIEREVQSLERIHILIANHHEHQSEERQLKVEGIGRVPWLLSTRLDTGQTLASEELSEKLDDLLRGLLFADRRPTQNQRTVLDPFMATDCVKLYGFPATRPQVAVQAVEDLLSRHVLFEAAQSKSDGTVVRAEVLVEFGNAITRFRQGGGTGDDVLQTVLGPRGMGNWTLDQIMSRGCGVLTSLLSRLAATPQSCETVEVKRGLLARLVRWLRRLWGETNSGTFQTAIQNPSKDELAYVVGRLSIARDLIRDLTARGGEIRPGCRVPPGRLSAWNAPVQHSVREGFQNLAVGRPQTSDANKHIERLEAAIRADLRADFSEVMHDIRIDEPAARTAVQALTSDPCFRYTGRILAREPQRYAAAASMSMPAVPVGVQRYNYWREAGLVMFAVSTEVPVQQLVW